MLHLFLPSLLFLAVAVLDAAIHFTGSAICRFTPASIFSVCASPIDAPVDDNTDLALVDSSDCLSSFACPMPTSLPFSGNCAAGLTITTAESEVVFTTVTTIDIANTIEYPELVPSYPAASMLTSPIPEQPHYLYVGRKSFRASMPDVSAQTMKTARTMPMGTSTYNTSPVGGPGILVNRSPFWAVAIFVIVLV
jgi:hypothetical protein